VIEHVPAHRAFVLVLAAALLGCGGGSSRAPLPTPSSGPSLPPPMADGWRAVESSPLSPANARHDDITFVDERTGWLVNIRGEVYGTTDGGQSWQRLSQATTEVFPRCVGFASSGLGWIGNINLTNSPLPDRALFETEDGGRTWSNISSRITGAPVAGLCGMRVLDARTVVAVGRWSGPAVFVKTTDGGRTWVSRDLGALTAGLVDVAFLDERRGFAVGGFGDGPADAQQRASRVVVLATEDGGETWQTRYLGSRAGERGWKIQFADALTGYVSIEGASPEGVVLRTADGGRTWERRLVAAGLSFEGVGFVSPRRGWLGSGQGLFATQDGGANWQALGLGRSVNRIRVLGPDRAFAAGDRVYAWTP
jgi:photosystem II stability/assembly factor-like uncharacterized protein